MNDGVNPDRLPLSWKILASGYVPEYLYEQGRLEDTNRLIGKWPGLGPIDAGRLGGARCLGPFGSLMVQSAYRQGLDSFMATRFPRMIDRESNVLILCKSQSESCCKRPSPKLPTIGISGVLPVPD